MAMRDDSRAKKNERRKIMLSVYDWLCVCGVERESIAACFIFFHVCSQRMQEPAEFQWASYASDLFVFCANSLIKVCRRLHPSNVRQIFHMCQSAMNHVLVQLSRTMHKTIMVIVYTGKNCVLSHWMHLLPALFHSSTLFLVIVILRYCIIANSVDPPCYRTNISTNSDRRIHTTHASNKRNILESFFLRMHRRNCHSNIFQCSITTGHRHRLDHRTGGEYEINENPIALCTPQFV